MAKKEKDEKKEKSTENDHKNIGPISKSLTRLNDVGKSILNSITLNTFKTDSKSKDEIDNINQVINKVLMSEMDDIKSFGGEDISGFIMRTLSDKSKDEQGNNNTGLNNIKKLNEDFKSIEDLFTGDNGDIFNAFNERYKNKLLLLEDLDAICDQLIELEEAVNTTRDSIVTADDIGSIISRSLNFESLGTEDDRLTYKKIVTEVEDELRLAVKIKNHIVPKTLRYGEYYAYIIPQSKLFENFQKDKLKSKKHHISFEAAEYKDDIDAITETVAMNIVEEEQKPIGFAPKKPTAVDNIREEITDYLEDFVSNIEICNEHIPLPVLESDILDATEDLLKFNDEFKRAVAAANGEIGQSKPSDNPFASLDGVLNIKNKKMTGDSSDKLEDFGFIQDCYIKLISPKQMRPVKIMDYTIGYYYVYESDSLTTNNKKKNNRFTTNFNLQNYDKTTKNTNILNTITNKVVKSFDKKYLQNNEEFKSAILNSLMYYNTHNKTLHFQFIPAEYVCEFKVNEDENGEGVSILAKSLFYAKLYLALLMYTLITYMSRSADTRIYYIKNSGIDTNYSNKVQEIARDIKSKQIKFTDLLSYNSITSKVGAGREIFMPVGKSGERGIEFDILSGQDVPLQNELMEMLKQGYINGSGVPSVIMNYINEADYAKTLVMANAKYLARVISYQLDFNTSLTKMYKMIMAYSTSIPREVIDGFEFKFMTPKALVNNNFTELTQYGDNILDYLNRAVFGENAEATEELNMTKDIFRDKMSREIMPFLPWETIDEVVRESTLEMKRRMEDKKAGETE